MSANDTPPDPFPDPDAPYPGSVVNAVLEDSSGGLIWAVKEAVIVALKEALTGSSLSMVNDSSIHVDYEYSEIIERLPGVWVQFSITSLKRAGISHEVWPTPAPDEPWEPVQEWMFEGRITLSVAALTSLERDRISDTLITQLAFARPPQLVLTDPQEDTKQFRSLITILAENPYVSLTLNTDQIVSGGQGLDQGPPWAENMLIYEDTYTVECLGQFNVQFAHDGTYKLSRIDIANTQEAYNPFEWH
jgi:hypothetical protein